ncbi:MAG: flagellar basal-body rod protein FlgG [Nitrospira sp.]|nr:flagellar basal-body rod protein FlgG [Nitrospira sp.]
MQRSMFIAATGMEAQRLNIDVVSNNLANVNTNGYKKSRADFQELLYHGIQSAGAASASGTEVPTGIQVGLGVKPAAVQKLFQQGDFVSTGNNLDMTIEGKGFFQVTTPEGNTAYTRAGSFKLDSSGNLVNSDGYQMEPAITIPEDATSITITPDGTVSVLQSGSSTPTDVGQMQLAQFVNAGGLEAIGKNLYLPSGSSGTATTGSPGSGGLGTINQGFLELSNVNVVEEMVNMIVSQRAYEMNSKVVQTSDEMLSMANNIKR